MRSAQPVAGHTEWEFEAWARAHVQTTISPAVLASGDGSVVASNQQAQSLLNGGELPAIVRALVIDTMLAEKIQSTRTNLPAHAGESCARRFDLTLFPVPAGLVLIVARDSTLEANMLSALAASRQLFRDVALCSTDFAFETDVSAYFTYVSPAGLLGFSAEELHGSRPRNVFDDAKVTSLFSSMTAVCEQEVWTHGKSGGDACVVVTAKPMHDLQGAWCGTRGVVHDITSLRCHERDIAKVRAREELAQAVVTAMRSQVEPRRMLLAACDALCAATEADFASINVEGTGHCVMIGTDAGFSHRMTVETNYHGARNGNVVLARNDAKGSFNEAERSLLAGIVPHLGVAMALVRLLAHLGPEKPAEIVK